MSKETIDIFTSYLTNTKFNLNTLKVVIAAVPCNMLEFFDFSILSAVLLLWIKEWKLTGIKVGLRYLANLYFLNQYII
jgi:hypothetical protein